MRGFWRALALGLLVLCLFPSLGRAGDAACFNGCVANPASNVGGVSPVPTCLHSCGFQTSIDQRCVSRCAALHPGRPSYCVSTCSYYSEDELASTHLHLGDAHSVFTPLTPTDLIMLDGGAQTPAAQTPRSQLSPTTQPLSPSTNYQVMQACLQSGYMFSYCLSASRY